MLVIACLSTKGGVGKSTLTANLAVAARAEFDRIAILDMDPQHTMALWWKLRGEPEDITVFSDAASAQDGVDSLRGDGWDVVFIDTPGQFISHLRDAAAAADFVLLPIKPGAFDLHACRDGLTICEKAGVSYRVIINDHVAGEKFADEIKAYLDTEGIAVLDEMVQHRPGYISSVANGKAAGEMPGGHRARAEIADVWAKIKPLAIDGAKAKSRREAAHGKK